MRRDSEPGTACSAFSASAEWSWSDGIPPPSPPANALTSSSISRAFQERYAPSHLKRAHLPTLPSPAPRQACSLSRPGRRRWRTQPPGDKVSVPLATHSLRSTVRLIRPMLPRPKVIPRAIDASGVAGPRFITAYCRHRSLDGVMHLTSRSHLRIGIPDSCQPHIPAVLPSSAFT